jgi:hypothetical protein
MHQGYSHGIPGHPEDSHTREHPKDWRIPEDRGALHDDFRVENISVYGIR